MSVETEQNDNNNQQPPSFSTPPTPFPTDIPCIETQTFGKLFLKINSPNREVEVYVNETQAMAFVFFHKTLRLGMTIADMERHQFTYFPTHLLISAKTDGTVFAVIPLLTDYTLEADSVWHEHFESDWTPIVPKLDGFGTEIASEEDNDD